MSLGFRDQKEARRRRWRLIRLLFTMAALVGLGVLAYQTGMVLANREVVDLRLAVDSQSADIAALSSENADLRQQTEVARQAEADWRKRYEAEVPTGKDRELLALIREQMAKGADPGRIEFLVATAANERSCDAETVTKRFLLRTPIYEGASDAVTFADGAIVLVGQGESATDADGNPEAWFDAGKPVVVRFVQPGGSASEASGLLPLNHAVVRGNSEYRFSLVAGEKRGFVTATAERCAFP